MPPSPNISKPIRSWTSNEQAGSGKWIFVTWLGIAFAIALVTFLVLNYQSKAAVVHYTSIVVEDYGGRLPKPHYAVWDPDKIKALQDRKKLVPWRTIASEQAQLQGKEKLANRLDQLPDLLKRSELQWADTLIVQLRAHAQVRTSDTDKTELVLLTGEQSTEATSETGRFEFEKLLDALKSVSAQNIIVLADICDLDYAPNIGVAVNPIASKLLEICQKVKPRDRQNIWLICAARDYESNFVSHLRKRTLLQSACEYALDARSNTGPTAENRTITLDEFYQQIWRYYRTATSQADQAATSTGDAEQMPLLMRVGDAFLCQPEGNDNKSWPLTQLVTVARIKADSGKDEPKEDSNTENKSDPKTTVASTENTALAEEPLDAVLQYWQLRDRFSASRISSTGQELATWNWSPAQFAPHQWQAQQLKLAQLHFAPSAELDFGEALAELKKLLEMNTSSLASDLVTSQFLVKAYRSFQDDQQLKLIRRPWEDASLLPTNDRERWLELRTRFRLYAETTADVPMWASWARRHGADINAFDKLIDSLVTLRSALPTQNRAALDDQSLPFDTSGIQNCISQQSQTSQELGKALRDSLKKRKKLTWFEEHQLQKLLESPLLEFPMRQELWLAWKKLRDDEPLSHTVEPDDSYDQVNRGETVKVRLAQSDGNGNLAMWLKTMNKLPGLVHSTDSLVSSPGVKMGLTWCQNFSHALRTAPSPNYSQDKLLQQWHVQCLNGLQSNQVSPEFSAGIVLPASLSRALNIEVASSDGLIKFRDLRQIPLNLRIQRADGTAVDQVSFAWKLSTPLPPDLKPSQCLTISTVEDPSTPLNDKPRMLQVDKNKSLRLILKTDIDSRKLESLLTAHLELREINSRDEPTVIKLRVVTQQPNSVQLTAHRLAGSQRLPIALKGWYNVLKVMPIEGAKSRFQFAMSNLSSEPKRCRAALFAFPINQWNDQTTRPSADELKLLVQKLQPIAESPAVDLPPAELTGALPTPIQLQPVAPKTATAPGPPQEIRWLYFQILELDAEDKIKETSHAGFCFLDPSNAFTGDLLVIKPQPADNVRLSIEANPESWDIFGHTKLPIQLKVVDSKGIAKQTPPKLVDFNREQQGPEIVTFAHSEGSVGDLIQLNIGGYPRAVSFATDGDEPKPIYPSLAVLDVDSIRAVVSNPKSKLVEPLAKNDGALIFPAKDADGRIHYDGVTFKARIDSPPDSVPFIHLKDLDGTRPSLLPIPIPHDRQYQFEFDFQDSFSVSASASDVQPQIKAELNGRLNLQVVFGKDAQRAPAASAVLVFDFEPPDPTDVQYSPMRGKEAFLERGQSLKLQLKATDADSGIIVVRMAIDKPGGTPEKFDEQDILLEPNINPKTGLWECSLDADKYGKLSWNTLTVVAMSEDFAGNRQIAHRRLIVNLKPPSKPADLDAKAK